MNNNIDKYKETSKKIWSFRLKRKIFGSLAVIFACGITISYIVSLLYSKIGNFSVSVDKFDNAKYSITLSETSDFKSPHPFLSCGAVKEVTNIDGSTLINDPTIGSVDGEDNGTNYLCYTFYLINNGEADINVDYYITITRVEKGLDEAIRLMVISNRNQSDVQKTVYAKAAGVDENHNQVPEEGTTAFTDLYTVCNEKIENFNAGDVCRYTIVIWIEGNDPDCTDDKLGGRFKIDMKFNIKGLVEDEKGKN